MARLKSGFFGLLVVALAGLMSYALSLGVFAGLKIKGYTYLFRATEPYDLVIKHARILDGTGENGPFRGDIAIRDGYICGVGYINQKNSPVFDAGGLTAIPWPLQFNKEDGFVEHLLKTSYPRYEAGEIYLLEGPYRGLSLAEAASALGVSPGEMFLRLSGEYPAGSKVILVPQREPAGETGVKELLAGLTSFRAEVLGEKDRGAVKAGCQADLYLFKTMDYPEEKLLQLLKRGSVPEPVFRLRAGKFLDM
ncbi:MAG: hypothetical protein QHH10_10125 [Peptococcaceae bacterium]|nr:hypothetical protein [Peptococcaceae bacterium]MDH7525657.1 hypothetical protein [Peptococcaceae bacterium]